MLLMTVSAWSAKYFAPGSAPAELTIRRWLQNGVLPGRKVGGNWYVDDHAWAAGGHELVMRVLAAAG
ncbi:MAG TPA: hypothetical protein VIP30_14700 [Stenotrophomonas sp.]